MHEKLLIENFVCKERQERYLSLILTKKGRSKLRRYIAHFKDLDGKFIQEANRLKTSHELENLLKSMGAADICYVISENSKYDGKSMNLSEVTNLLFNSGIAYFLSCVPGKLVYYEGEETNQKFLLLR
jgi:hypothetical protein